MIRLHSTGSRISLDVIENSYRKEIGDAFIEQPLWRKKLLCAIRLYNESNYRKALKYLKDLAAKAQKSEDYTATMLFVALCFTEAGVYEPAIDAYNRILELEPSSSRAHSNLGLLYMELGDYDRAIESYDMAVAYDRENYYAYSNRASCYFRNNDFDRAIADAERALDIKNNGREAATLLTIVYSLINDTENMEKYYHIAISSGASSENIHRAIDAYRAERKEKKETSQSESEN